MPDGTSPFLHTNCALAVCKLYDTIKNARNAANIPGEYTRQRFFRSVSPLLSSAGIVVGGDAVVSLVPIE